MCDLAEISSLVARLNYARDDQDVDALLACWTEDAEIHFTDPEGQSSKLIGRDAIGASAKRTWSNGPGVKHVVSNPAIRVDGDDAAVRYYTVFTHPARDPLVPSFGDHRMTVRRGDDGQWRVRLQVARQYAQPAALTR
jgi:uncharacterized protein (TIGR02246 family)